MHRGRGVVRESGGRSAGGRRTRGIWKSVLRGKSGFGPRRIALFLIRWRKTGLCAGATTDVRGTPCAVGVQFSGRRFLAGGFGQHLRGTRYAFDGRGGSRWVVWFAA